MLLLVHCSISVTELKEEHILTNTSSIVAGTTHEDLGTVASTPATTEDYGSVTSAYLPPTPDYGDIVILPGSENPLGRLLKLLVETVVTSRHSVKLDLVHCLPQSELPSVSDSIHQKRPSSSDSLVVQLRNMLRIGSALAILKLRKRLLLLLMLLSDSVHTGGLVIFLNSTHSW